MHDKLASTDRTESKGLTRREFLKTAAGATLAFSIVYSTGRLTYGAPVKQELVVAYNATDSMGWDPVVLALPTQDKSLAASIYNGLLKWPEEIADPTLIKPDLAEEYEVSTDGLTWTFKLREGVKWHSVYGEDWGEFTAEDAAFSLTRAADPERSAHAIDYSMFESFETVDRYTVKATLKYQSSPSFLMGILADWLGGQIVCKAAVEKYGDQYRVHPVGTGPFKLGSYMPNESSTWLPHEEYYRGRANLDKYQVRYMGDVTSRELAFQKGEIQMMQGIREKWWVDKMKEFPEAELITFGLGAVCHLHYNMTKEPFNDIKVRKACTYAINKDEIVEFLSPELAIKNMSQLQKGFVGALEDEEIPEELKYEYNPDKAKDLLAQAGYPNGFDVKTVITDKRLQLTPLQLIQEMWRKVGINLELDVVAHSSWHTQIREDVAPVVLYIFPRFPTGDQMLTQEAHSASIVNTPSGNLNFSHYGAVDADGDGEIDSVDSLLDEARQELDVDRQITLWKQVQLQLLQHVPYIGLYHLKYLFVKKPWVDIGYQLESNMVNSVPIKETAKILDH